MKDLLQSMLDAQEEMNGDMTTIGEKLAGIAFDFLLAGYETTANTLAYTTYLLAMNPDVQEKLQAEIDQYFEDDPVSKAKLCVFATFTSVAQEASLYDATQKLKYLDMVVQESMRLYAPIPRLVSIIHTCTMGIV